MNKVTPSPCLNGAYILVEEGKQANSNQVSARGKNKAGGGGIQSSQGSEKISLGG